MKQKIENPIKNNLDKIFSKLFKKSELTRYAFLRRIYDSEREVFSIWYEATVGDTNDYRVTFLFEINLQFPLVKFNKQARAKKLTLACSYVFLITHPEVISNTIVFELKGWRKGELHERLFQKRFLEPLQKKYSKIIHNVIKTPDEVDGQQGVDFIIQLSSRTSNKKKEVHFNLKSSVLFLEEHKATYPNVSTFVFVKEDLSNMQHLEKRFLLFMSSALSNVVNF